MENYPLPVLFLIVEFSTVDTVLVLCKTNKNKIRTSCLEAVSSAMNRQQFSILNPVQNFFSSYQRNASFWFSLCQHHFQTVFGSEAQQTTKQYESSSKSRMDFLGFSVRTADPVWPLTHSSASASINDSQQFRRKWKLVWETKLVFSQTRTTDFLNQRFGALLGKGVCEEVTPFIKVVPPAAVATKNQNTTTAEKSKHQQHQQQKKNKNKQQQQRIRKTTSHEPLDDDENNDNAADDEEEEEGSLSSIMSSSHSSIVSSNDEQQEQKEEEQKKFRSFVSTTAFVETPSGIAQLVSIAFFNENKIEDFWWTFLSSGGGGEEVFASRGDPFSFELERDYFIASPQPEFLCGYHIIITNKEKQTSATAAEGQQQMEKDHQTATETENQSSKTVVARFEQKIRNDLLKEPDIFPAESLESIRVLIEKEQDPTCAQSIQNLISFYTAGSKLIEVAHEQYFAPARREAELLMLSRDNADIFVRIREVVKNLQTPKGNYSCPTATFKVTHFSPSLHVQHAEHTFQTFIKKNWSRGLQDFFENGIFPFGSLCALLDSI